MPDSPVSLHDSETVYRRIPRWNSFFNEPDHVTTSNFKLKPGEKGISVYSASVRTPESVLEGTGNHSRFFLLRAIVQQIHELRNAEGRILNLKVLDIPVQSDPGHAEIRKTEENGKITKSESKALRDLFKQCIDDQNWQYGP